MVHPNRLARKSPMVLVPSVHMYMHPFLCTVVGWHPWRLSLVISRDVAAQPFAKFVAGYPEGAQALFF